MLTTFAYNVVPLSPTVISYIVPELPFTGVISVLCGSTNVNVLVKLASWNAVYTALTPETVTLLPSNVFKISDLNSSSAFVSPTVSTFAWISLYPLPGVAELYAYQ